jgi:tetratricopeptide (TPR) repeat protein
MSENVKSQRKIVAKIFPALAACFLLSGCVGVLNPFRSDFFWRDIEIGNELADEGNFLAAKKRYAMAINEADVNYLKPEDKSCALYDYGRMCGLLGNFDQAENCLLQALDLEEKSNDPEKEKHSSMRFFELARLYQAWGKNTQAVEYYEKAIASADKQGVDKSDPVNYAVTLEDYAKVLDQINSTVKAQALRQRAKEFRDANPGVEPKVYWRYYPSTNP